MRLRSPPLASIEAFIVAASSPSFRAAAETLALSPAAISRRIQSLSDHLGVRLFERRAGGAVLTEAGRKWLGEVEPAYRDLLRATAGGARGGKDHDVRLSLSHSMAVGWLIPRLSKLNAAHPQIELSFRTERTAADLRRGDVDLAICFSDIDLSEFAAEPFLKVTCTPLAAPEVAEGYRAGKTELGAHGILAMASPADVWPWWRHEAGIEFDCRPARKFDVQHAVYEAAAERLGVTMGSSATVWPHLEAGRLAPLGLPTAQYGDGYWLAASVQRRRDPAVAAVWRWLKAEAAASPHFDSLASPAFRWRRTANVPRTANAEPARRN